MTESTGHAELGPLTEGLFDWVLWIFELPDAGLWAGATIVLVGIIVTVLLWFRCAKRYYSVWSSHRKLIKYPDRYEFTDNFDSISDMFMSNKELKRAWYEFYETLILPPDGHNFPEPRYNVVQNTRRPQEYFNLQVIPALRVKPAVAPSTFVAIGLLLTFVGLVAALTSAATAFTTDGNDGAAIEQAINNLLIVAGAKFFASIGGLISSLMVSVCAGWWQNRINSVTSQLCDDLEKRTWFVSQTQVASDQYAHAIRQTDRLEELKDQLAVSIGEQFRSALDEVPDQIAGAMGGQFGAVIESINALAQTIAKQLVEGAGSVSDELRKDTEATIRTMVEQLQAASNELNGTTNTLQRLATGFDESSESLKGAAGQLYQATNSVRPLIDSMQQIQEQANATQDVFNNMLEQLHSELQTTQEVLQSNVTQSRTVLESLQQTWGAQAEQLRLNDAQLEAAFTQIERMTRTSVEHLNEQLSSMDSSVANISSYLNNKQSQLTESIESLDETVSRLVGFNGQ